MRSHKALHAAAIVLVIAAAVIRLHNLGAVSHYIDNAYPIWQALGIIDRGVFPLTGQMSSIGIPNPPLTAYLFVPVVMMTRSALVVYVVVILLNSLAVGLGYLLGKRLFNASVGLLIAALMAFNPWLIEYSRFTWVQSLMPFLMTLLALLLMPLLAGMVEPQQRFRQTFALMITILVIVGTYLLGVMILLPIAVLFLIYRTRLDWRAVALGGVIMLLMLLPYAIQTINLSAEGIESNTDSQASLSTTALFHAVRFVTGDGYAARFDTNLQMRQSLEQLVVLPVLICLLAGVVRAVWAIWKHPGRERSIAVILLVWLVLTILPLSYSARPVQVHYQM